MNFVLFLFISAFWRSFLLELSNNFSHVFWNLFCHFSTFICVLSTLFVVYLTQIVVVASLLSRLSDRELYAQILSLLFSDKSRYDVIAYGASSSAKEDALVYLVNAVHMFPVIFHDYLGSLLSIYLTIFCLTICLSLRLIFKTVLLFSCLLSFRLFSVLLTLLFNSISILSLSERPWVEERRKRAMIKLNFISVVGS